MQFRTRADWPTSDGVVRNLPQIVPGGETHSMISRFVSQPSGCARLACGLSVVAFLAVAPVAAHAQINPFVRYRGPTLSRADLQAGKEAALRLLDHDPATVGTVETWKSPSSGDSGSFTIERVYRRQGRDCRDVRARVRYRAGTERSFLLRTCHVDGQWKLAD